MATAPQHAGRARRWTARGLLVTAIAAPVLAVGIAQAHAADVPAVEDLTTAGADTADSMETTLDDMSAAEDSEDDSE